MKITEMAQFRQDALAALAPILVGIVLPAIDLSLRNLKILGLYPSHFFSLAVLGSSGSR